MDAGQFTIYGLVDSASSSIRYVGQTHNLRQRITCHRNERQYCPLHFWKRGLKFFGRTFSAVELELVEGTRDDALGAERFFIDLMESAGCRLLNSTAYWARCKAPVESVHAYFGMLTTLFSLAQKENADYDCIWQLARTIDRFESANKSMILFRDDWLHGDIDCFADRVKQLSVAI